MTHNPTPEQIAALQAFAAAHGRKWKSILSEQYWFNARIWHDYTNPDREFGVTLHGIRNQFGPSWLYRFKLPK